MTSTIALIEPEEQARVDAKAVADEYRETIHKLIEDLLNAKRGWPSDLELAASTELTTLLERCEKAEAESAEWLEHCRRVNAENVAHIVRCVQAEERLDLAERQRDDALKALEPFTTAARVDHCNLQATGIYIGRAVHVTKADLYYAREVFRAARAAGGKP